MEPLGDGIGKSLNKNAKIIIPLIICFILGFFITVSEPDLQVLAEQVPTIDSTMLISFYESYEFHCMIFVLSVTASD